VGGQLDLDAIQTLPGWVLVGENELQPDDVFFSGYLWAKLDMLDPTAGEIQREQIERLHGLIAAVPLEDIDDLTPRAGWMPVEILTHWINEVIDRDFSGTAPLTLARQTGRIVIAGIDYEDTHASVPAELGELLGWLNYETLKGSQDWASDFTAWASAVHERRHTIACAYNRRVRGYRCRQYAPDPLTLPRWGELRLHPYQVAAVHQVLEARCGLLAFDAGLGKTYAALAIMAAARRDGEARRPVIVVPKSLVWKWYTSVKRVLPDYRVCVIGSRKYKRSSGDAFIKLTRRWRAGELSEEEFEAARITSKTDTSADRREKWTAFCGGSYDVVIMTSPTLDHVGVSTEVGTEYEQAFSPLLPDDAAHNSDGALCWDGVDFLLVDELAHYKNLFAPAEDVRPRYMGIPDSPSKRALQLHKLAYATRSVSGRVVGLTATPAKNSPLEIYNLLHIIDPAIWERAGFYSPTAFVDRFVEIRTTEVPNSKFALVKRPAAVGFKHLSELWGISCKYMVFQSAEDSGLKLPIPRSHIVPVDLDKRQTAKTRRYIESLKDNPHDFLGTQIKLSLVAIHGDLDGSFTWDSAATIGPDSPKFDAIAQRVIAGSECGHVVFVENPAAQRWLVEVLSRGIDRGRIAVLNGSTSAADRQQIATAFNRGDYHVVIANSVAHEGIDLQLRTCGIHHADLPWTPADLEQRNGRAVRQGNQFEAVEIYYYIARGSVDRYRLALIHGKAGWLKALGDKDMISNPAAAVFLDREDLLMAFSDGEARERLIERRKRAERAEEQQQKRRAASWLAYRAAARFRDARQTSDLALSMRRTNEGTELLRELAQVNAKVWPWASWMGATREVMALVPVDGSAPVFEGLRVMLPSGPLEFGRLKYDRGTAIGARSAGSALWTPLAAADVSDLGIRPEHMPGKTTASWPSTDDESAITWIKANAKRLRSKPWTAWGWAFASERFVSAIWSRVADVLAYQLQKNSDHRLPILARDRLELAYGSDVLRHLIPPTLAGWRTFVVLAQISDIDRDDLETVARYWWGRTLPRRDP